jgi:hypothetical protein
MYEVDFRSRLTELKDRIDPTLLHYESSHIVLEDDKVIGDIQSFMDLLQKIYGYEDVYVENIIIYNRQVRECSYQMMAERGNPVVTLQFDMEGTRGGYDDLGTIYIELYVFVLLYVLFC